MWVYTRQTPILGKFPLKRSVFCVLGYIGGVRSPKNGGGGGSGGIFGTLRFPFRGFSRCSPNHLFRRLKLNCGFRLRPSISKKRGAFRAASIFILCFPVSRCMSLREANMQERERERGRDREIERERDTEKERERESERDRKTERERETGIERDRQ